MKKNTFWLLLTTILYALLLSSCSGATCHIDNPTDAAILISIDGKEPIKLEAGEYRELGRTLSMGEYTMKVNDTVNVKFKLDKDNVMLNPTLSTYIKSKVVYGEINAPKDTLILIDGKEYAGNFTLVSSDPFIYIGDIDYDPITPLDEEVNSSKNGVVMTKIVRKRDFESFYKDEFQ